MAKRHDFGEYFTFTSEREIYKDKLGFKAYNSQGLNVGIVYACDDRRQSAFGCCELCIYEAWKTRYGQWHIITSHGAYINYNKFCEDIKVAGEIKLYVD